MRIITKKQEVEILARIYSNHKIANAEIKDTESFTRFAENQAEIVSNVLGSWGIRTMARLLERELMQEDKE